MGEDQIHSGHRQRMYDRIDRDGIESLAAHEILEFLLYFSLPRVNTNEIAHRLLERFGTLRKVINADREDLLAIKGVGMQTVRLLKALPYLQKLAMDEEITDKPIHSPQELTGLLRHTYSLEKREVCYVFVLDACRYLTYKGILFVGGRDDVPFYLRDLIEVTLKYDGAYVVVSHNHLGRSCSPSTSDNVMTREIQEGLRTIGVVLLDHIIVSPQGYYSYALEGDL